MVRYYTRITNRLTGEVLYEYDYTFNNTDEVIEDVYKMIKEEFLPYLVHGYTVEIYDTLPDVPGVTVLRTEKL